MKKCSTLFKGNLHRLQALSVTLKTLDRIQKSKRGQVSRAEEELKPDDPVFEKILGMLQKAQGKFERDDSKRGIGLSYYHQALILLQRVEMDASIHYNERFNW